MLFLSRMHPKKGVLELVEAWHRVKPTGWTCELVYSMGSDVEQAYAQQVKQRILELGMSYQDKGGAVHSPTPTNFSNFILTGSLDDNAKWAAYRRADCFVLPTHTENFGIVIAEALYAGLPVITTKGAPWQELETSGSGWWTDVSVEAVADAISKATALSDDELQKMGLCGHELVVDRYSWGQIAARMKAAYEGVMGNSAD